MIILHVTYQVKKGRREDFLKKLAELQVGEKSREEAGCVDYSYHLPVNRPEQIFLVEVWQDEPSLAAHQQSEHFKQLGAVKGEYVDNTALRRFQAEQA